jgi:endo-1,4-beta-xylanase
VALNERQFTGRDTLGAELTAAQFNSISPENALKWQSVHPQPGVYAFDMPDAYVAFGERHGMKIIGHNLVWHSQTPRWVFQNADGGDASRDTLIARMRDHIHTVAGRYRGRIAGWDVVNEALNEDGTLRQSPWMRIIGEDYLAMAFTFAHEADPDAELYYNDYSLPNPAKRDGAVALIRSLQAKGVTVTGIGMQGHYNLTSPTLEQVDAAFQAFQALGIKIMITELDIDVLPGRQQNQSADISNRGQMAEGLNPYVDGLPDTVQEELANRYADLFGLFYSYRETIDRVTFWGVTDGDSWKNNFPIRGRTNYPLLFGRDGKPKPAFDAVIGVVRP